MARGRTVDVGINIRAIDSTRRAIMSARRGFAQLRNDFLSVRPTRMSSNIRSSMREIRAEIRKTSGITRGWYAAMWRGADITGKESLPRLQKEIKKTSQVARQSSRGFVDSFGDIDRVMRGSMLTMGLFSISVVSLGKKLIQSTLDMDQYIRGFKVLDGGLQNAKATMQDIIEVSKLPGIQIPAASRGYMNLRAVGVSGNFAIKVLEEFSNAVAIAGGRSIDLRESIRQLSQTLSINKIDMENWRVMLERIPTMRIAVQKAFGPKSIHTEHLAKVMEKEGLTAEQTWRHILQQMMFTERADPNTITNAIERLQNSLWHMAANIGAIYAPAIRDILKSFNTLAEGFNNINKPTREFIAGIFNTFGGLITFGGLVWGVIRIFKGVAGAVTAARNAVVSFRDAPIVGEGGFLGRRAAKTWGASPDLTRRELMPFVGQHRKRRSVIGQLFGEDQVSYKDELDTRFQAAEADAQQSRQHYNQMINTLEAQKRDQERLIRSVERDGLRADILDSFIQRDIDAMMQAEFNRVQKLRNRLDAALKRGDKTNITSLTKDLDTALQNLTQGFDQRVKDTVKNAENYNAIVDDMVRQQTQDTERGAVFDDPDREKRVQDRIKEGRNMIAQDLVGARKDVRETQRLRDRAWANLRSINHFAVWTEVVYGGIIAGLLGLGAVAISQLMAHFQELGEAIGRFDKYMNKHAGNIIKWENQYKTWKESIRNLSNEYEFLSKSIKKAFESELKGLGYIEKTGEKLTDDQQSRKQYLESVLDTQKVPLTQYSMEYWENEARRASVELLKPERVSEAYETFGRELEKIENKRKNIPLANQIRAALSDTDLDTLLDKRQYHQRLFDEILKIPDEQLEGTGWIDKRMQKSALAISRLFEGDRTDRELYSLYASMEKLIGPKEGFWGVGGPRDLKKALDNLLREREIQERQARFTEMLKEIQRWRDTDIGEIGLPDFIFSDVENWAIGISGARVELARLREELLTFSIPMQNYQKSRMSYLQSIISLEDTATKQTEKLNQERRKAQDKFDLNEFLLRHKTKIQDIITRRPDEQILTTLGRQLGEEALPRAELDEINRILQAAGGDKKIKSIVDRITQASVHADRLALEALTKQYTDLHTKFIKDFEKLQQDWLRSTQRGMQDVIFERIAGHGSLGTRIQTLRRSVELMRELREAETDPLKSDAYTRAIKVANSQLQALVEQRGVDIRKSLDIWSVDPTGNILGMTESQLERVMSKLSQGTSDYGAEVYTIFKLWERVRGINTEIGDDTLNLSGEALREIHQIMEKLVSATTDWEMHVGNVEQRLNRLTGELINAPKEMREVIRDRMSFVGSLEGPDRARFDKLLDEYKRTFSEIAKLEEVQQGGYSPVLNRIQHALDNFESFEDLPLAKTHIESVLSELKKMSKEAESGKIDKLRRQLSDLVEDMDKLLGGENAERALKYLTNIRIKLNDIATGVPPAVKLQQLREELERMERTESEPGKAQQRISDIQAIKDKIREQEFAVSIQGYLNTEMKDWLPMAKENAEILKQSAEAQEQFNDRQSEAVKNYNALIDAKRRDAIADVIADRLSKGQERTEQSKAVDRIRKIGVRDLNNRFLSPAEREDAFLSGVYGQGGAGGGIASSQYRGFMAASRRHLNDLELERHYWTEYYKPDESARQQFLEKVAAEVRERTGEAVTGDMLRQLGERIDAIRAESLREVITAIDLRKTQIEQQRDAVTSPAGFAKSLVTDFYDSLEKEAGRMYDRAFEALWGAWVDSPRTAERRAEDRRIDKQRQIEDIKELRRDREISAREMRDRLQALDRNFRKETLREEQNALLARERMWEDFFGSLLKGMAKVAAETVKTRAGVTAGNWLSNILGLDALPGGQQKVSPTGGFFSGIGDNLKQGAVRDISNDAAGWLMDMIRQSETTGGIKQLVDQVKGAADPEKLKVSSSLNNFFYERGKDPWIENKNKIQFPEELYKSVVKVQPGAGLSGTGFFVDPNTIATNYHVVESMIKKIGHWVTVPTDKHNEQYYIDRFGKKDGSRYWKEFFEGTDDTGYKVESRMMTKPAIVLDDASKITVPGHGDFPIRSILALDPANDLALLSVDAIKNIKPFKLQTKLPEGFDALRLGSSPRKSAMLSLGYPEGEGMYPQLDAGYLRSDSAEMKKRLKNDPLSDRIDFILSSASAYAGESGSPLIDSITGDVYGVLWGGKGRHILATESRDLQRLMDKVRQKTGAKLEEVFIEIVESDLDVYLDQLDKDTMLRIGDNRIISLDSVLQLSRELSDGTTEKLQKSYNTKGGYSLSGAGSPFLQDMGDLQTPFLNYMSGTPTTGMSWSKIGGLLKGKGGELYAGMQNFGTAAPHALAIRMIAGTLMDGFNPSRRTKPDAYYSKNPFNRFLHDIIGVSFDNPANDMAARTTAHSRANRIAKMLGMNTPKDLIENYESGMVEGFANAQVANSQPTDSGGDVKAAIDAQTSQIVDAITNSEKSITVVLPGTFTRDLTHDQQKKSGKAYSRGLTHDNH